MSTHVDIGFGRKEHIKGLKGFTKRSFISYIKGNQEANRIPKGIDPEEAWEAVEKHVKKK